MRHNHPITDTITEHSILITFSPPSHTKNCLTMPHSSIPEALLEKVQGLEEVVDLIHDMTHEVMLAEEHSEERHQEYSDIVDASKEAICSNTGSCNLYVHYGFQDLYSFPFECSQIGPRCSFFCGTDVCCDDCYERGKKEYIESFMDFRCGLAEKELALTMHGPHPSGGCWSGFNPIQAHVREASTMALFDPMALARDPTLNLMTETMTLLPMALDEDSD